MTTTTTTPTGVQVPPITDLNVLARLTRDLTKAGAFISEDEAAFLVTMFYEWQDRRKASDLRQRALEEAEKPSLDSVPFRLSEPVDIKCAHV